MLGVYVAFIIFVGWLQWCIQISIEENVTSYSLFDSYTKDVISAKDGANICDIFTCTYMKKLYSFTLGTKSSYP